MTKITFVGVYKIDHSNGKLVSSARYGKTPWVTAVNRSLPSGSWVTADMITDPEANVTYVTVEIRDEQLTGCVCLGENGEWYVSTTKGWIRYDPAKHHELLKKIVFQTSKISCSPPMDVPSEQEEVENYLTEGPSNGGKSIVPIPPLEAEDVESLESN